MEKISFDTPKEFQDFLSQSSMDTPSHLDRVVKDKIYLMLNPSLYISISKFVMIQILTGILTLSVCPQFGIGPLGGELGLTNLIYNQGELVCAAFCGAFYFGVSVFIGRLFLTNPELLKIRNRSLSILVPLVLGSLFVLWMIGTTLFTHVMFNDFLTLSIWAISGFLFGITALRFGRFTLISA